MSIESAFLVEVGILKQVDGSAKLTCNNTTAVVSVTGPIEAKPRSELPTQASLEIVVRPSRGLSGTREKLIEDKLRSVLQLAIIRQKFPRQVIQVVVQFLVTDADIDGQVAVFGDVGASGLVYIANELSCALNAAFLALVDANVALFSAFAAVSIADGTVFPSLKQTAASSHHVVCFAIENQKASRVLLAESNGDFSEDELVEVIERASKECDVVHEKVQRPAIEAKVQRDYVWRN